MSRISQVSVEQATGERAELYTAIKATLGSVPNLFQAVGASPRALKTFLGIGAGLRGGLLSGAESEAIALAVAQANGCDYCLAAHTVVGGMRGLKGEEVIRNRRAESSDPKRNALLTLVSEIVTKKGRVSDATYQAFINAGYTEAHVPEVLLVVTENIFTNYFNNLNGTDVDFPPACELGKTESCSVGAAAH